MITKELEAVESLNQKAFVFLAQLTNVLEFFRFGPLSLLVILKYRTTYFAVSASMYTKVSKIPMVRVATGTHCLLFKQYQIRARRSSTTEAIRVISFLFFFYKLIN